MPSAEPLDLPDGYGQPSRLLDWADVVGRLETAPHYWLATVRPDGRPHVVPVDGLWADDRWYFGGSDDAVRQRNLVTNPRAVLHLEDAESAVVVEGRAASEVPSAEQAEALVRASEVKYGWAPPVEQYGKGVWTLWPDRVLAWTDFPADATRFRFA